MHHFRRQFQDLVFWLGGSHVFWSGGCDATSPPFVEVGPTHVFVAASDAEQSVGERRSQVFGSRSGTSPCGTVQAATATLGKPKSDTAPKRKTDFTKKWDAPFALDIPRAEPEARIRFSAFRIRPQREDGGAARPTVERLMRKQGLKGVSRGRKNLKCQKMPQVCSDPFSSAAAGIA